MKEKDIVNVTVDSGGHQIFHFSDKCQIKSIKPLGNKTLEIEVKNQNYMEGEEPMSRAEKFIQDYTTGCSNELEGGVYHEWLTPEQALRAVEIEREELIEKACEFLKSYRQDTHDGTGYIAGIVNDKTIDDFKKFMKEE